MMRPPSSPSKVTSKKTQIWVRHARPSGPIDCWWCAILRPTSYEDDGDCLRPPPPPPPPVPTSLPYPTIWKKATIPSMAATVSSKLLLSRDSAIATWIGPPLTPLPSPIPPTLPLPHSNLSYKINLSSILIQILCHTSILLPAASRSGRVRDPGIRGT